MSAAGSAHAEGDPVDVLGEAALRSAAGDHLGAIERYEQAYHTSGDVELLTILGSEYHDAGKPGDAIQNLCAYLAVEPAGVNAAFAAAQVRAIQAELGPITSTSTIMPTSTTAASSIASSGGQELVTNQEKSRSTLT